MSHRFPGSERSRLKDERRRAIQPVEDMIARMSPRSREICADLGSGTGYIAIPLSHYVSKVIALDAQRSMLETLIDDAGGKDNIETVVAEASHLPFTDVSLDRVVMVNVLHEIESVRDFISDIRRMLRPGGRVSVVDFPVRPTSMGPPLRERVSIEDSMALFEQFRVIGRWELDEYYQLELGMD